MIIRELTEYQENLRRRLKEIQDYYALSGQCQRNSAFTLSKAIVNYLIHMQHVDADNLLRYLQAQNDVLAVTQDTVTFSPIFLRDGNYLAN